MKAFIKNVFGNQINGEYKHSFKKVGFVLGTLVAYIVPQILLYKKVITGTQWIDFYKIIIPATMGLYGAGKWVDGKNAGVYNQPE